MARVGRLLRQGADHEASLCLHCRHPQALHLPVKGIYQPLTGEYHDGRPGVFECASCDCEVTPGVC